MSKLTVNKLIDTLETIQLLRNNELIVDLTVPESCRILQRFYNTKYEKDNIETRIIQTAWGYIKSAKDISLMDIQDIKMLFLCDKYNNSKELESDSIFGWGDGDYLIDPDDIHDFTDLLFQRNYNGSMLTGSKSSLVTDNQTKETLTEWEHHIPLTDLYWNEESKGFINPLMGFINTFTKEVLLKELLYIDDDIFLIDVTKLNTLFLDCFVKKFPEKTEIAKRLVDEHLQKKKKYHDICQNQ
ncbi:hypothetical protein fh0823_27930 (plasmid) [Francisella halioticida]|uniref:hypothetical protein n=1 Tax=Francisella halioticida TaxID=549298 RepID=UPI001AF23621|nr:hypothetical protein [Francisella halioticida]BCD92656.1 hypothetical protein fh0823_27930 [Francisella halioticida]